MTSLLITICILLVPDATLAEEKNLDKVLATVGNEQITEADILAKTLMLPPQVRVSYETPEGMKKLLDEAVKSSMLSQEAQRLGIPAKEDVARKIKGISDTIIIQELTKQEVTNKVTVKEEAITAYYNDNKEKFIKPEEVNVNLILFAINDDDPPQKKKEIRKKAEQSLKQIKEGEKIGKLAGELSDDKVTSQRGGSTGFFARGKHRKTYGEVFEAKAFSLKAGELSDVFEGKGGFYIIKVVAKKERHEQTLNEVGKRIEKQLRQKKQKEAYESYVESLKKRYPVTIY
jgi:peptidyl-prolyl cis-trans isomerase C